METAKSAVGMTTGPGAHGPAPRMVLIGPPGAGELFVWLVVLVILLGLLIVLLLLLAVLRDIGWG